MQTIPQQQIDTNTSLIDNVSITIKRSDDAHYCLIAYVNDVEYAYVWIDENPFNIGSDDFELSKEEEKAIMLQVGLFLENEPIEEETEDYSMDETYDFINANFYTHY